MSNVNKQSAKQRISERIKASAIANRLQDFALAKAPGDEATAEEVKEYQRAQMTGPQVTAAFKLLAKVVPDLKQIDFDGKITQQITQVTRTIVKPEPTDR